MLIALGSAQPARAQGFVSPFIGYNFGGDSSCPAGAFNCEDKHVNYGVSFGALVKFIGFEVEIAYTPDFFGANATGANVGTDTNVLTSMGNLMLAPRFGFIRPYGVSGAGMIRTSVSNNGVTNSRNQVGFDGGRSDGVLQQARRRAWRCARRLGLIVWTAARGAGGPGWREARLRSRRGAFVFEF
jgi:hypothetical protein